jgi:hypothetical protein
MRLDQHAGFLRRGVGHVGVVLLQCSEQARGQIRRQERRITGHRQQIRGSAVAQARFEPGQRARKIRHLVGQHGRAKCAVRVEIAVGTDRQRSHLRSQARQHVFDHRAGAERLQALVHVAHA